MVIRFDDVVIDADAHELRRSGDVIDVQPQVLSVLLYLIEHHDRVVSKEELLDAVWQHRFVTESALTSRIKSARQASGDNGRDQRVIRTIHGRGYRFVAKLLGDGRDGPDRVDIATAPAGAPSSPRVRLPAQSTPFVGRRSESVELARLLGAPDCRLLTIVGPGGMGKTRLSLAVGEEVSHRYADGVRFVSLVTVVDGEQMLHAIAEAVELPLEPRRDPATQLCDHLADKQMLLVFDNMEHLSDVGVVSDLVAAAPGVQILATSRERLHLRAEWTFELAGMQTELTDGRDVADAIELFACSARRVHPDFSLDGDTEEVVRALCRMVGGMPLAVELAAGWSQMLPVTEIVRELERGLELLETELRDVPERHRSIRTVFDATWQRLDDEARSVFMQLSVFRGGFTRAAAEGVVGARLPVLRRLAASSVLTATADDRYTIHELLRQYGEERLDESGDGPDVRRRHSEHYLGWLAEQAIELRGGGQRDAIDNIAVDIGNIRAAWMDAVEGGRLDAAGHTVEALWLFADARGNAGDLGQLIRVTSDLTDTDGSTEARVLLRCAHGLVLAHRGLLEAGHDTMQSVIDDLESAGDDVSPGATGLAQLWYGWVSFLLARYDEADEHTRRALATYTTLGDRWGVARCQYVIGNIDTALGRLAAADEALQVSRTVAEAIDDRRGIALASRNLAILAGWFGRYAEARVLLERVASISREFDDRLGTAYALRELGKVHTAEGDASGAAEMLRRSIAITDEIGNDWESAATANDLGNALLAAGDLDGAEEALRQCLAGAEDADHRYFIARCVGDLGVLAARRGDTDLASHLLDDALARWQQLGHEPYGAWVLVRQGDLAAERSDRRSAIRHYRDAIALAERHGLAPVALEAVVGAADAGVPGSAALRRSLLDLVAGHEAADERTRRSAQRLVDELGREPVDRAGSGARGEVRTWRDAAAMTAAHLAGHPPPQAIARAPAVET